MNIDIMPVKGKEVWPLFAPHHYLTEKYAGHRAFLAVLAGTEDPVAFTSSISFPHWAFKNGRREHRTVVLPDFQGLGIGIRLSDWLGEWHLRQDHRFYSRTTHPRMGAYRDASPLWTGTAINKKKQGTSQGKSGDVNEKGWYRDINRVAFSHQYIGGRSAEELTAIDERDQRRRQA